MQSKKAKHIIYNTFVVILTTWLISSQLFKSLHYFVFSHKEHSASGIHNHLDKTPEKKCPVCKFDFYCFTNELNFYKDFFVTPSFFTQNLVLKTLIKKTFITHKKGRGPPLFLNSKFIKKTE